MEDNRTHITPPRATIPLPAHATPIIPKNATSQPFTSMHTTRRENITLMWQEITGKVVGPMPAEEFLNKYLPLTTPKTPSIDHAQLLTMRQAKSENAMYGTFINAFKGCCSNFVFADTHHEAIESFEGRLVKCDVTLRSRFEHSDSKGKFTEPGGIKSAEIMIEHKICSSDDPFSDEDEKFERETTSARDTLGQITTYATAQMAAQFRIHIFSLLVFQDYARILRWDRGGVVVTEMIDLEENAAWLAEFLCRYDSASPEQQGHDDTVTTPSREEVEEVSKLLPQLGVDNVAALRKITFPDGRSYIIGTLTYMGIASPTGRSTRTFKAFALSTKRLVFLKDTWRVLSDGLIPEHEVYAKLHKAHVRHVATVENYHDITQHVTRTSEPLGDPEHWVKQGSLGSIRRFQHYRLVLNEFATSLSLFANIRELVIVIRDALTAHRLAHDDAGILHRDISAGNIMITEQKRGLLVDWDLSKDLGYVDKSPPERTGTWQFLAAQLILKRPPGVELPIPNRSDDQESFWYVLLWIALRNCEHGFDNLEIVHALSRLFDDSYNDAKGSPHGGENKSAELCLCKTLHRMKLLNQPLHNILVKTAKVLSVRYSEFSESNENLVLLKRERDELRKVKPDYKLGHLLLAIDDKIDPNMVPELLAYDEGMRTLAHHADWMECVLNDALDDPQSDWETGKNRVSRVLPIHRPTATPKRKNSGEISTGPTKKSRSSYSS